jgi:hypothetical protein
MVVYQLQPSFSSLHAQKGWLFRSHKKEKQNRKAPPKAGFFFCGLQSAPRATQTAGQKPAKLASF